MHVSVNGVRQFFDVEGVLVASVTAVGRDYLYARLGTEPQAQRSASVMVSRTVRR